MNKNYFIIAVYLAIIIAVFYFAPEKADEKGFESEVLAENLDTPWAIDFLPDGRMIFTERPGSVSVWDKGKLAAAGKINVSEVSESGLLGIAVDPEFEENGFVYVYYTHELGNRV